MVIAIIKKSRPLIKRDPLPLYFVTDVCWQSSGNFEGCGVTDRDGDACTDACSNVTSVDADGNVDTGTDACCNVTSFDADGNVDGGTDACSNITSVDADGNVDGGTDDDFEFEIVGPTVFDTRYETNNIILL